MNVDRTPGTLQGSILVAQAVLPAMGAVLLVPVLPMLFREYGAMPNAEYWIPALITVPGLCIALLSPVFGALADRLGRRKLLIAALSFYGLAGIAPLALTSFTAVFVSRVVLGIGDAAVIVISATMLGDLFEGVTRARWLALISTLASLSAAVFLGLSGAIGGQFGWRAVIAVYALALLFIPAMILFTWEPRHSERAELVADATPLDRSLAAHLWLTGACTLFGATLFYTLVLQQGLGLTALGTVDAGRLGLLTAVASIGNPVGTLIFRRFAHVSTPAMLAIALAILGMGLAAMGLATGDIGFAAAAFVGMLGAGLLMPTLLTWTMASLPFATRGRGTAVFQSMFAFGQFVSGLALPFLTQHVTSNLLHTFGLFGLVALAAAIGLATLRLIGGRRLAAGLA